MACDGIMRAMTVWIIDMFQLERFDIFLYRFFIRLERWMAGEIIIFWLGIDNLGLRQRGISSGQPVSEILTPLQTWQGWKLSPSPEFSWETLTLAEE